MSERHLDIPETLGPSQHSADEEDNAHQEGSITNEAGLQDHEAHLQHHHQHQRANIENEERTIQGTPHLAERRQTVVQRLRGRGRNQRRNERRNIYSRRDHVQAHNRIAHNQRQEVHHTIEHEDLNPQRVYACGWSIDHTSGPTTRISRGTLSNRPPTTLPSNWTIDPRFRPTSCPRTASTFCRIISPTRISPTRISPTRISPTRISSIRIISPTFSPTA